MTARQLAVQALLAVETQGGYSNLVLAGALNKGKLSKQDGAFASVLFYGVLERKITLDFVICHYTKKPIKKLTPAVVQILRTAFYQLLYMDKVPSSAVVNESVGLTRQFKCTSASGFVNGVLRSFLRDGGKIPTVKGSEIKKLSIEYSCPEWLVKQLVDDYGKLAAVGTMEAFLGRPVLYARVNTLKTTSDELCSRLEDAGIGCVKDEKLGDCVALTGTGSIENIDAFEQGLFHIQDKSCQMAAALLAPQKGERVLDACSAPGSKSFTMAQLMENCGEIISCDVHEHKIGLIADGAKRLGISIIKPMLNDGTVYNESLGQFDRVLCDVPCSGLGVMGKKPEIRYKAPEDIKGLAQLQYKILENSSKYCKPNGVVMYSTCTLAKDENLAVAQSFLDAHPEFELLENEMHKSGWHTTLLPQDEQTDGFFFATMRRKNR